MHDLRRLLKYLKPHLGTFSIATFAMLLVGVLEGAMRALIVPIFDQEFGQAGGRRTPTLFGLQKLIPASGLAAWRSIALLLIIFTVIKGIGPVFDRRLKETGIRTFAQLAALTPEQVAAIIGWPPQRVIATDLLAQASKLAESREQ